MSSSHRRAPRRTTVNAMLYIGVLAMAAITWFDYRSKQAGESASSIDAFEPAAIQLITVHRPGFVTLTLQRQQARQWALTSPISRTALTSRVEVLLALGSLNTQDSYNSNELNLAELGLGSPTATLNYVSEQGNLTVLLGGKGPDDARRYLQIGQQVWLVEDLFLPLISGGLDAFADLQLLQQGQAIQNLDGDTSAAWQQAIAAGIRERRDIAANSGYSLQLDLSDNSQQVFIITQSDDYYALIPEAADYALLLLPQQAAELGLDGTLP